MNNCLKALSWKEWLSGCKGTVNRRQYKINPELFFNAQ